MKIVCPMCHSVLECRAEWNGQKAQCSYCRTKFVITEIMLEQGAAMAKSKWRFARSGAAALLCVAAGVGAGYLLFAPANDRAGSVPKPRPKTAAVDVKAESPAAAAAPGAAPAPPPGETAPTPAAAEIAPVVADPEKPAATAPATAPATAAPRAAAPASSRANVRRPETTKPAVEVVNYTYEYYGGVLVPYYRGYYYIGKAWVWHGHGKPPCPPPRHRPAHSRRPAPAKDHPPRTAPGGTPAVSRPAAPNSSALSSPPTPKPPAVKSAPNSSALSSSPTPKPAPGTSLPVKTGPMRSAPPPGGGHAPRGGVRR